MPCIRPYGMLVIMIRNGKVLKLVTFRCAPLALGSEKSVGMKSRTRRVSQYCLIRRQTNKNRCSTASKSVSNKEEV